VLLEEIASKKPRYSGIFVSQESLFNLPSGTRENS
jgi:hypothetical protein